MDLYATALSILCLLHCLALPLLTSLLPLSGQLSQDTVVHRVLVLLAAPATLWAAWKSRPIERHRPFLVAAACGLSLLVTAVFLDAVGAYEQPITVTGALLLASAHLWRLARHRNRVTPADGMAKSVKSPQSAP